MFAGLALIALLSAQQQPAVAPPQRPKLICRESQQQVGSHIRTGRRCKSAEEWQREDSADDRLPLTLRVVPGQGDGVPKPQRPPWF